MALQVGQEETTISGAGPPNRPHEPLLQKRTDEALRLYNLQEGGREGEERWWIPAGGTSARGSHQ